MSSNLDKLTTITYNLGIPAMNWENRRDQVVSKVYPTLLETALIVEKIVKELHTEVEIVESRNQTGMRILIRDVPRFMGAIEEYEKKTGTAIEQMKILLEKTRSSEVTETEVDQTKKLLNKLCNGQCYCDEQRSDILESLEKKFPLLDSFKCRVDLEPLERGKFYWLKVSPELTHNYELSSYEGYWKEKIIINADQVKDILQTLKPLE